MSRWNTTVRLARALAVLAGAAACARPADQAAADPPEQAPAASVADTLPAPINQSVDPAPGGQVVTVKAGSQGVSVFVPAEITARPGDVIRFVAEFGVHNVHFPEEQNPQGAALPRVSDYLLREGDRYELRVDLPPGVYRFQCDPHAGMGMTGTLTVAG